MTVLGESGKSVWSARPDISLKSIHGALLYSIPSVFILFWVSLGCHAGFSTKARLSIDFKSKNLDFAGKFAIILQKLVILRFIFTALLRLILKTLSRVLEVRI
jgi:hypothetical protein